MGVVNVTPDSFSDGGKWLDADTAVRHGLDLVAEGADLIDVGGESTRPGALRIDAEEELRRVIPVVTGLVTEGVTVSVDTMRADVAERALDAGATLINDVSGGRADERMTHVAASSGAPIVLMHWRGHADSMQKLTQYDDVVADVARELSAQVEAALSAGVRREQVVIDPGLGFSKTGDQNWTVLAHLDAFIALGYPVLVAASRKRFLGELLPDAADALRPTHQREAATAAISAICALAGAWCVRVHEAAATADAVRVVARLGEES
ncbi:dihydropteroate synthase [Aeromicrobium sp.]|uniref:dihydropteroate synthase n=1 Tax=Aeromicrobium sp. TaxID=1871063 RepID=UPI003D6B975B